DDVAKSMKSGELSQEALRRLVDYRLLGATPARGNLTLNPIDITNQQNLAKIGANSTNKNLHALAIRQNENTGVLLGKLNELGASTTDDAFAGGQRVIGALSKKQVSAKSGIDAAYNAARDTQGRSIQLDHVAFTNKANDLIDKAMVGGQLPSGVRDNLNKIAKGEIPFTVEVAEQFKTQIGILQRSSSDGTARMSLGLVRQALDDTPILQSGGSQVGKESIAAFNTARRLNREWRALVEKTPALKAVEDGVNPDKFVQDFIIRGAGKANVMDVARLKNQLKDSPDALNSVREQILSHLKSKATSGNPDEAMILTQSGYNRAFDAIGERKLRMFFNRAEIDQLKAIGRVARYEQIQPSGSAVNNSNSGALAVARGIDLISGNPLAGMAAQAAIKPTYALSKSIQAGGVRNIPRALMSPQLNQAPKAYPWPLVMTPGLLEDPNNKRR
ncbi:MAG: hypothetical protein ABIU85_05590, partial [Methylotenera sp.]